MSGFLGLDTSNYTTSAAYLAAGADKPVQAKQLLPVKAGEMGLRQSDAVFHHTRQLPEILERLTDALAGGVAAVAGSDRPQQVDGSYMPCFLVGAGAARQLGAVLGVPTYFFTHQQGHVMAALTGAECLSRQRMMQLSSGSTSSASVVGHSLDLKAGQLIDRVGGLLGLPFPAGPALEQLALQATDTYRIKATLRGTDCHLSGVENQCRDLLAKGTPPAQVARFCLDSVGAAVEGMTQAVLAQYGDLPVVYAGGVMSNGILKQRLTDRFGGRFAPPMYSADNAAGIACLCRLAHEEGIR